ncbi:endonuclease NucS [Halorarum salinum]|uniref:Endonuclease NucS n=1 Tax=Halorarum salinum TaxID=2743089 RepID=A0A7D5LCP3_9EURY|nr:endonuclease NucS [Halobaculum salinum]QLG63454.1 endonuclease NucS [Halobaculum salinum]
MTVVSLHEPSHRETLWELEAAFARGDTVSVFGECTVEYDGRAASSLGPGARLLVLKPDGTALVHTDEGRTPVNWQPPGCEHHAAVRDGRLRVRSVRTNPAETLEVRFSTVEHLAAYAVTGGRSVEVVGSEADLKARVLEVPSLVADGFEPLETERETDAGPVDVFGVDADGNPVVVELKRRRVGPDAVGQLGRYVSAVEREEPDGTPVAGVLVAPSVTARAKELLAEEGLELVAVDRLVADGSRPTEGDDEGAERDANGAGGADGVDRDESGRG